MDAVLTDRQLVQFANEYLDLLIKWGFIEEAERKHELDPDCHNL